VNAERQWRLCFVLVYLLFLDFVGTAVNAERQWRPVNPSEGMLRAGNRRDRRERRKAMETPARSVVSLKGTAVGTAVNAERQWRQQVLTQCLKSINQVGTAVNAERQWRPQLTDLIEPFLSPVGTAVNAERQWRRGWN